jgi:hypothetical protein
MEGIMDINAIAGTAVLMQSAQTAQGISTTLIKMAADQQNQMATMLAQSAQTAAQTGADSGYTLSTYA